MLLFQLKKCIFHTQMQQLATLNTWNKYHTKMKGSLYCMELQYHNLKNSTFSIYKLMHTNLEKKEDEKIPLPSLMWNRQSITFAPIKTFYSSLYVRFNIDKDFRIYPFMVGASQAISVISNALAAQNYEALNELVDKRAIKVLENRVDKLTSEQRKLIAIQSTNPIVIVASMKVIKTTDKNEVILQVTTATTNTMASFEKILKNLTPVVIWVYVFQRRYRKGIGESWIVKLITNETL